MARPLICRSISMPLQKMTYCVHCGLSIKDEKSVPSNCLHLNRLARQLLIPCSTLYKDVDWILYTVDDDRYSVFLSKKESIFPQMIGYGGIILRNPSIVFKTWQLENVQQISLFLKTK